MPIVETPSPSPRAADVGRLAVAHFVVGGLVNPLALTPQYFRKSAAEEKAARFV
jgi:hypothetical protein